MTTTARKQGNNDCARMKFGVTFREWRRRLQMRQEVPALALTARGGKAPVSRMGWGCSTG
ncbi:hypothetical protein E2562_031343 [Oryza meyeriana var. granulata]|uniref:Uncharacterized protein n=1 Tax=Oryza meyeriana var. granulata TaxID=110450 RepID=A0A6G1D9J5_9ORYZ|nr:hypothetical protein E2562_031343 [Oryza meyeriana var. granulata]